MASVCGLHRFKCRAIDCKKVQIIVTRCAWTSAYNYVQCCICSYIAILSLTLIFGGVWVFPVTPIPK